jgi:hypothetical protein
MAMRFATVTAAGLLALIFASAGTAGAQSVQPVAAKRVAARVPADDAPVRLRLAARVVSAPADFSGLVRVTPNADYRLLRVVLDSDNFYRSSDIQLEGDRSPTNHFLWWRSLPAGTYRIVVTVFGTQGPRTQVTQEFLVVGDVLGQPMR